MLNITITMLRDQNVKYNYKIKYHAQRLECFIYLQEKVPCSEIRMLNIKLQGKVQCSEIRMLSYVIKYHAQRSEKE